MSLGQHFSRCVTTYWRACCKQLLDVSWEMWPKAIQFAC